MTDRDPSDAPKPASAKPVYSPDIFEVPTIAAARHIILTREQDQSTDERWENETPFLARQVIDRLSPGKGDLVLDYGCGVGRVSRELIQQTGCSVLGVDISERMRALAIEYVGSPRFCSASPDMLDTLIAKGFRADHAIAVWVLQHCQHPVVDIARIASALIEEAGFMVVNSRARWIPTDRGWARDAVDVEALLATRFAAGGDIELGPPAMSRRCADGSFGRIYRRRP